MDHCAFTLYGIPPLVTLDTNACNLANILQLMKSQGLREDHSKNSNRPKTSGPVGYTCPVRYTEASVTLATVCKTEFSKKVISCRLP